MDVVISFIIPHKGREEMLLQTLQSIAELDIAPNRYEVVLVSQNNEHSPDLLAFQETLTLTILTGDEQKTISHSRNIGAKYAKGQYFAFLDADVALSPNWADVMLDSLQSQEEVKLVASMQINSHNAPYLERIRTALTNAELDTFVQFLPGRNLFLHRDTFYSVEGFPEHLVTCEDYFFTDKVSKQGKLYYTSAAHYVHIGEDKDLRPMFKKEIWRGQSNLASLSGRRIPLREIPSFIVPIAICGLFLLSIVLLVFGLTFLGVASLLLAAAPLMIYTGRLKSLVGNGVSALECLKFYLVYFPARAIGTLFGLRQRFTTTTHN